MLRFNTQVKRLRGLLAMVLLGSVAVGTQATEPCPPLQLTADGVLLPEVEVGLDLDFSGRRDLLEALGRVGVVKFQLDNINDGVIEAGPDGFRDAGLRCPNIPHPDGGCTGDVQCADLDFDEPSIRSSVNSGKLTIIYLPDTDGVVDPLDPEGTDDSVLYVGMDIFNGAPEIVGDPGQPGAVEGINWWPMDLIDSAPPNNICEDGVRDLIAPIGVADNLGVPFDVDSDGFTRDVTRWQGLDASCVPGAGCGQQGATPSDTSLEEYRLLLYACTDPDNPILTLDDDRSITGDCIFEIAIRALPNGAVMLDQLPTICPGTVEVPPAWIQTFPQAGTLDTDLDGSMVPLDVEFIICHVESVVNDYYGTPYTADRLKLAQGGIRTFSDSNGDSAAEDAIISTWFLPLPSIEVTKQIRCVEVAGGSNEWREHAEALPGSQVEFKVEIENTGNVAVDVTVTDILEAFGDANVTVLPGFLQATLYPRDGAPVVVTPANAGALGLVQNFFVPSTNPDPNAPPSFLNGIVRGEPRDMGTLRGLDVCNDVTTGDRIELIFRATVDAPLDCDGTVQLDVQNAVSVTGSYDDDPNDATPAVTTEDIAFDPPDTYREKFENVPPADDNVVTVNILCRDITLQKEVAYCPDCNDPNTCGAFGEAAAVPPDANFPVCVQIRYTIENLSDVPEMVTLTDAQLCAHLADAGNPGVTAVNCPVCPSGYTTTLGPVGDPNSVTEVFCTLEFASQEALDWFVGVDDVADPNNPTLCGGVELPGSTDPDCYSNCAEVSALVDPNGIPSVCNDAPAITVTDDARICRQVCELTVDKKVVCIDCDDPSIVIGDPNDSIMVIPDSCVRFIVTITNISEDMDMCRACRLQIEDLLADVPGQIVFDDNVKFFYNDLLCASVPAGFVVNGDPFDWLPSVCGQATFDPNDVLRFEFDAHIPPGATTDAPDDVDASNTVERVDGYVTCPGDSPAFIQTGVPATVTLDIKRPSVTCEKQWQAKWDSDGDCEPGPACLPDPNDCGVFTAPGVPLDLREAIFPVELTVKVTATNDGEVPLKVTAHDAELCACVSAVPGVSFVGDCVLCDPNDPAATKEIAVNGSETWECKIRVETADAMRALAASACHSDGDDTIYTNTVTVTGELNDTGICQGGPVSSTCSAEIIAPPVCSFDVFKDVKCVDEDDTAYGPYAEALPGSSLRYRVRVVNTSAFVKLPRVCVTDVFCDGAPTGCECVDWFDPTSVVATLGPIGSLTPTVVTDCVSPSFNVTGQRFCVDFLGATCRPDEAWIGPGEELIITFDVDVPADYSAGAGPNCTPPTGPNPDCRNDVTVEGYTEFCPTEPDAVDACATGSANAEINVLVPGIECLKEVCIETNDPNALPCDPNDPNAFSNYAAVPCNAFPFTIVYKLTVINTGETGLTNVQICDPNAVTRGVDGNDDDDGDDDNGDDVSTGISPRRLSTEPWYPGPKHTLAGVQRGSTVTYLDCDLCDDPACMTPGDGCADLVDLLECGDSAYAICKIHVPDQEAWLALTGGEACYTNTSVASATVVVDPDPNTPGTICDAGADIDIESVPCEATVCATLPCNIEVTKGVRCQNACPDGTWMTDFLNDGDPNLPDLKIGPGTPLEYSIKVENLGGAGFSDEICRLQIVDEMLADPNASPCEIDTLIDIDPDSITFTLNGTLCPQPAVTWENSDTKFSVEFDPDTCPAGNGPMLPGDVLEIRFCGIVKTGGPDPVGDPNGICNLINTVVVAGAPECPPGEAPIYCCEDDDQVEVDIVRRGLLCLSKAWGILYDADADGVPGPPDDPIRGPNGWIDFQTGVIDLFDPANPVVFPIRLYLRVTGENTGDIPLTMWVEDPNFCDLINSTPGAAVLPGDEVCENGEKSRAVTKRLVLPGQTATWMAAFDIESFAAFKELAANDVPPDPNDDPNALVNLATVYGVMTNDPNDPNDFCVLPEELQIPMKHTCGVVLAAGDCNIDVTKEVVCLEYCPDPAEPPPGLVGTYGDSVQMGRDSCARFRINIANTGVVPIPRICITDTLGCGTWVVADSVTAMIGIEDVSACFTDFETAVRSNARECYAFDCRLAGGGDPWLAPGETLTLTFDVHVPAGFNPPFGSDSDCENDVRVEAYTEAFPEVPPAQDACALDSEATIDVVVPGVECDKRVGVDFGVDGVLEIPLSNQVAINPQAWFPLALVYEFTVENTGELPLEAVIVAGPNGIADTAKVGGDVQLVPPGTAGLDPNEVIIRPGPNGILATDPSVDDEVVGTICDLTDLVGLTLAAGGTVNSADCDLCDAACDGTNDDCIRLPRLAPAGDPGDAVTFTCTVEFPDRPQFELFLTLDADGNDDALINTAEVVAMPDYSGVCPTPVAAVASVPCQARVSAQLDTPKFKVTIDVIDENEIIYSGMERCVESCTGWISRWLTTFTLGTTSPNNFITPTDRSYARIDAHESPVVCPGSINTPVLGVLMHVIQFQPQDQEGLRRDVTGYTLRGVGVADGDKTGWIKVGGDKSRAAAPAEPEGTDPALADDERIAPEIIQPVAMPDEGQLDTRAGLNRADMAHKGSLLIFPKVELKWNATGRLIQDAFIQLTNDIDAPVRISMFMVNGDPNECEMRDMHFQLTGNQASYWSLATGQPGPFGNGLQPFTIVEQGPSFDDDPSNPGGIVLEGYIIVVAVSPSNQEIRWNHLLGEMTHVRYDLGTAFEYKAYGFQNRSKNEGELLNPPYGVLDLDGDEYNYAPNQLVFGYYVPGATLQSDAARSVTSYDSELTLLRAIIDLTDLD